MAIFSRVGAVLSFGNPKAPLSFCFHANYASHTIKSCFIDPEPAKKWIEL